MLQLKSQIEQKRSKGRLTAKQYGTSVKEKERQSNTNEGNDSNKSEKLDFIQEESVNQSNQISITEESNNEDKLFDNTKERSSSFDIEVNPETMGRTSNISETSDKTEAVNKKTSKTTKSEQNSEKWSVQ